ncbi:hypothetical protein ACFYWY_25790 [Streptomyces sp. NPDC002870]|uniref:hypothetical protein n=1 Tax=Streptomyces sp. NPDC002870 TaxID=3364666 RepID=UPI0036AC6525
MASGDAAAGTLHRRDDLRLRPARAAFDTAPVGFAALLGAAACWTSRAARRQLGGG